MSITRDNPEELSPVDDELVAYLDNELDEAAVRRIEERLACDANYRRALAQLEKTWDCLDQLPGTLVNEAFTRATIEMVTVAAAEEVAQGQVAEPRQKRRRLLLGILSLIAALGGGFFLATKAWPDPNERLIHDLPLLVNLDRYLQVDSIEFLRLLAAIGPLTNDVPLLHSSEPTAADWPKIPAEGPARREYLLQLAPEHKAQLAESQRRFAALPKAERQRVRHLHAELELQPDFEELQALLTRYYHWLRALSPGQRADLAALEPHERIERIKQMRGRQLEQASPADRQIIQKWLEDYVSKHRDEILAGLTEEHRQRLEELEAKGDKNVALGQLIMMASLRSRNSPLPWLSETEVWNLHEKLTPEGREQISRLESRQEQQQILTAWIQNAVRWRMMPFFRGAGTGGGMNLRFMSDTAEELERFFDEKLTSDQREWLLSLPREEMEHQLRRLYYFRGSRPAGMRGNRPFPRNPEANWPPGGVFNPGKHDRRRWNGRPGEN